MLIPAGTAQSPKRANRNRHHFDECKDHSWWPNCPRRDGCVIGDMVVFGCGVRPSLSVNSALLWSAAIACVSLKGVSTAGHVTPVGMMSLPVPTLVLYMSASSPVLIKLCHIHNSPHVCVSCRLSCVLNPFVLMMSYCTNTRGGWRR